jgi:hypothetical protein
LSDTVAHDAVVANDVSGELTIGMLVDSIYMHREGDYSDLPRYGTGTLLVGETSTVEAERQLALT